MSSFALDKHKSQELKGVAILFMIFGHLMTDSLSVYLGRFMGPVAFFLILSGYGMYEVNQKTDIHRWSRILRLFVNYWFVLAVVLLIGQWSNPNHYMLSVSGLMNNIIALDPTYIPEVWFLLPYVLLSTSSRWIISFLNRFKGRVVLIAFFLLSVGTSFCLSRFGSCYLYTHRIIYVLFCYFHLMFPFILGILMAKYKEIENRTCSKWIKKSPIIWLILLSVLRCFVNTSVIHPIYAAFFILFFSKIEKPKWIETILQRLGQCSMNMWFIHTSVFVYLWSNRPLMEFNPIVYFIIVVLVCWILSEFVNLLTRRIVL